MCTYLHFILSHDTYSLSAAAPLQVRRHFEKNTRTLCFLSGISSDNTQTAIFSLFVYLVCLRTGSGLHLEGFIIFRQPGQCPRRGA